MTVDTCGDVPIAGCYDTLADAVAAAGPGGTVQVADGEYPEALVLPEDVTLSGGYYAVLTGPEDSAANVLDVRDGAIVLVQRLRVISTSARPFRVTGGADLTLDRTWLVASGFQEQGAIGFVSGATVHLLYNEVVGGVAMYGGQIYVEDASVESLGGSYYQAQAWVTGGALIAYRSTLDFSQGSGWENDQAGGEGGAIAVFDSQLTMAGAAFRSDRSRSGAAVYAYNSDVAMTSTDLQDNEAWEGNGAILQAGSVRGAPVTLSVHGLLANGNTADYVLSSDGPATVAVADFTDNRASPIFAFGLSLSLVTICGNTAPAAIYALGDVELENVAVWNNDFDEIFSGPVAFGARFSTIAHNAGLVLAPEPASLTLDHSIVADNPDVPLDPYIVALDPESFWVRSGRPPIDDTLDPLLIWYEAGGCSRTSLDPAWVSPAHRDRVPHEGEPVDLDETAADSGWHAGPGADPTLWSDIDEDGYPAVYDCRDGGFQDEDALTHPGAIDPPYDAWDQDCDGWSEEDGDHDGYDRNASQGGTGNDCNDHDSTINPGATDVRVDGIDEDCGGVHDRDGDGLSPEGGDCDDANPAIRPGSGLDGPGLDGDCDGFASPLVAAGCANVAGTGMGWVVVVLVAGFIRPRR